MGAAPEDGPYSRTDITTCYRKLLIKLDRPDTCPILDQCVILEGETQKTRNKYSNKLWWSWSWSGGFKLNMTPTRHLRPSSGRERRVI